MIRNGVALIEHGQQPFAWAVHYGFIGISNEWGAFESGVAAALLGTVGAVGAGGTGTVVVVALVALIWPEVRRLGRLAGAEEVQPVLLAKDG